MAQGEHLGLERGSTAEQRSERPENGQKGRDHRRSSLAQVRKILNDDGPDQFLGRHKDLDATWAVLEWLRAKT